MFLFFNFFSLNATAQCGANISMGAPVLDCGCVEVPVYIAGVPAPTMVRGLRMYVNVSNSTGITWDITYINSTINSKFAGGTLSTSVTGGEFSFDYFNLYNYNTFGSPTQLFRIRYCGVPGEVNTISIGSHFANALIYRSDTPTPDGFAFCNPSFSSNKTANNTSRAVSGEVIRPTPASACVGTYNQGIKNVDVRFENVCSGLPSPLVSNDVTNTYGEYDFEGVDGGDYRVTMFKDDNPGCGINSFDILDFSDFILDRHCYDDPWQVIAMDVNLNNMITTADKTIIQTFIINGTPLPYAWKFVPVNQYDLVTNLCNPDGYPTLETYQDFDPLNSAQSGQDWAGIKLGDIDGSCTDCDGTGMFNDDFQGRASGNSLTMEVQAPIKRSKDILDIPISIDANAKMDFLILHTKVPKGWDVLDVVTSCQIDPEQPIIFNSLNGELKLIVSLSEFCNVTSNEPVLYIRVKTNGFTANVEEYFHLIETEAFNYIYNDNRVILPLSSKSSVIFSDPAISMRVLPNPSSGNTQIHYNSDEKLPVHISIMDQIGRTLFDKEEAGGVSTWNIDVSNLPAGLYFVTLSQEGNRVTEKLIVK